MSKEMNNNIVIYQGENGEVEFRADIQKDTIWASQRKIAELFDCTVDNVSLHLKNIFADKELVENSVTEESSVTGADGKKYMTKQYNLDAIIAVGYRVNSKKATQFRIWATGVLREYLKNGYVLQRSKLGKSPEAIEGLTETLALIESERYPGKLKGKITLKITKDLEPKKR
jgi:hypothetical protein